MSELDEYLQAHRVQFEEDLCQLLRIPSVSADSNCEESMRQAARCIADGFRSLGLQTEEVETAGHPIIFAQSPPVPNRPVVLVYGHYDVQPADPLEEWISPPFDPTCRDGSIFARGATDDKGQLLTHVKSVEAWMATRGQLPIQIKYLIEGEEEIGSPGLQKALAQHADRLACDVVVISDTSQLAKDTPAITYGLRGIATFELRLDGPSQDLHSGIFGGTVTNPANALAAMISALTTPKGRVQVPGFYDDVVPLSEQERRQMAALPFDEQSFMEQIGVDGLTGEEGFTTLERRWARPTFDVNGLTSGYQGEGAKTIVPAWASAKLSFRLVPHQDPAKIGANLRGFLESLCPSGIRMELSDAHGSPGVVMSLDSPYMKAAAKAIERSFGRSPVFIREGGSIPIVTEFCEALQVDTLLLGWGLNDDNAHGPNEKFSLTDFHRGIRASALLWEELGKISKDRAGTSGGR